MNRDDAFDKFCHEKYALRHDTLNGGKRVCDNIAAGISPHFEAKIPELHTLHFTDFTVNSPGASTPVETIFLN